MSPRARTSRSKATSEWGRRRFGTRPASARVFADTTIVDQLADYPFKQSIAGTVIGGSGIYAGASGTVGGSGTIVFDDKGNFDPDTTIEIDLA